MGADKDVMQVCGILRSGGVAHDVIQRPPYWSPKLPYYGCYKAVIVYQQFNGEHQACWSGKFKGAKLSETVKCKCTPLRGVKPF